MSSQFERQKKNYDKYMEQVLVNPKVVREMNRQLLYANTIDDEASQEASKILANSNIKEKTND